ncbi:hypothetical protein C8R44DRAFT_895711 [Mycena epipterygia]|nr:hypothetical protein C8R44DRAFT_895711 [Mycena epipterygia]
MSTSQHDKAASTVKKKERGDQQKAKRVTDKVVQEKQNNPEIDAGNAMLTSKYFLGYTSLRAAKLLMEFAQGQTTGPFMELVNAKKCIWGMLEPFLCGGLNHLCWVGMETTKYGEAPVVVLPNPTLKLVNVFCRHNSLADFPWLMNKIVVISEVAYEEHLHKHFKCFGQQNSTSWTAKFKAYVAAVVKQLKNLVEMLQDETKSPAIHLVLDDVVMRTAGLLCGVSFLNWQLDVPIGYLFVPNCTNGVSLLMPAFINDLYRLLMQLTLVLLMITGWLVPGITDNKALRTGHKITSDLDVVTPSETCQIVQQLAYFWQFGMEEWKDNEHASRTMYLLLP